MADPTNKLGEVRVDITGDMAGLRTSLDEAKVESEAAGKAAGTRYVDTFGRSLSKLRGSLMRLFIPAALAKGFVSLITNIEDARKANEEFAASLRSMSAEFAKSLQTIGRTQSPYETQIRAANEAINAINDSINERIAAVKGESFGGMIWRAVTGGENTAELEAMAAKETRKIAQTIKGIRARIADAEEAAEAARREKFYDDLDDENIANERKLLSERERLQREYDDDAEAARRAIADARTDEERRIGEEAADVAARLHAKALADIDAKEKAELDAIREREQAEIEAARKAAEAWARQLSDAYRSLADQQNAALTASLERMAVAVEQIQQVIDLHKGAIRR